MVIEMSPVITNGKPIINYEIEDNVASMGTAEKNALLNVINENKLGIFTSNKIIEFEEKFSKYCKADYGVSTNSGTAALHTAIAALGIKPGDEVIVPAYTYMATAMAILHQLAIPIFVDITLDTFAIDHQKIEQEITKKTKAIMAVHLFGHAAPLPELKEIAEKHDLFLIEDCAQALGAEVKGKKVGTWGTIGCFSFQEHKNMATGEGGMLITNDNNIAEIAKKIRHEGEEYSDGTSTARPTSGKPPLEYKTIGYNYRMSAFQAALGLVQLKKLDSFIEKRISNAKFFNNHLNDIDLLKLPICKKGYMHTYNNYVLLLKKYIEKGDEIQRLLKSEGIPVDIHYPVLPKAKVFKDRIGFNANYPFSLAKAARLEKNYTKNFDCASKFVQSNLILPTNPNLSKKDLKLISEAMHYTLNCFEKSQNSRVAYEE
jgi:perosamine synthetase